MRRTANDSERYGNLMLFRVSRGVAGSALLLWCALATAGAQQAPPALEVTFRHVTAQAGDTVIIPVFMTSPVNVRLPFTIRVPFPARQLSFLKLESGMLARRAGWTLTPRLVEPAGPGVSRLLEIEVEPGEARFFPSGAVAYAHFKIAEQVEPGDLVLNVTVEGAAPELRAVARDLRITVGTEPVFGCFFYMH